MKKNNRDRDTFGYSRVSRVRVKVERSTMRIVYIKTLIY